MRYTLQNGKQQHKFHTVEAARAALFALNCDRHGATTAAYISYDATACRLFENRQAPSEAPVPRRHPWYQARRRFHPCA